MTLRTSSVRDLTAKRNPGGGGTHATWLCMGCNTSRLNLGSRGAGVRRRCAHCVAKREAACS